jgi:hypothetical protein
VGEWAVKIFKLNFFFFCCLVETGMILGVFIIALVVLVFFLLFKLKSKRTQYLRKRKRSIGPKKKKKKFSEFSLNFPGTTRETSVELDELSMKRRTSTTSTSPLLGSISTDNGSTSSHHNQPPNAPHLSHNHHEDDPVNEGGKFVENSAMRTMDLIPNIMNINGPPVLHKGYGVSVTQNSNFRPAMEACEEKKKF